MAVEQVEAKHFKKGGYIMIDDVPCRVVDNAKSAPGKHGHLKCKIEAIGVIDNKKRMLMKPGDAKIPSPIIDKRQGQVVSVTGDHVQLMDMDTYEMFETVIPDELKGSVTDGKEVEYWAIEGVKSIMSVK
ncbi:MAG: translation initiation factor IF-5A [archaeon]